MEFTSREFPSREFLQSLGGRRCYIEREIIYRESICTTQTKLKGKLQGPHLLSYVSTDILNISSHQLARSPKLTTTVWHVEVIQAPAYIAMLDHVCTPKCSSPKPSRKRPNTWYKSSPAYLSRCRKLYDWLWFHWAIMNERYRRLLL